VFRNRLYYYAKPYLPFRVRLALRRWYARSVLRRCGDVWPIKPGSEKPPVGWPGWPEGKQFAVTLTHDVEGQRGLDRVKQLAELEMELGFRSSFNFVPEGEYTLPTALRSWLVDRGFEVGVHDLHHDGRLYRSREEFRRHAQRINHYLREWGAVGFRSGFMLHNLDWLHDLDIEYDASTFDTDPFEPQPDGVGTIFPFWVSREQGAGSAEQGAGNREQGAGGEKESDGNCDGDNLRTLGPSPLPLGSSHPRSPISSLRTPNSDLRTPISGAATHRRTDAPAHRRTGYVELPYTLIQDFNLFIVLRAETAEFWRRKIEWIVAHGGMVHFDTHPDYMAFGPRPPQPGHEFDANRYLETLRWLRDTFAGQYWHALPREAARHTAPSRVSRPVHRRPRRIAMLTHSCYECDNRVMRYAQTLAGEGHHVQVLALGFRQGLPRKENLDGVLVHRLHPRLSRRSAGPGPLFMSVFTFTVSCGLWLAWKSLRQRFDLVHVHNIPDFLVFAALVPKLTGTRVILDIHDLVPELYASKFGSKRGHTLVEWLKFIERMSCRFANHVIISNHLWRDVLIQRSMPPGKCSVFINHADPSLFRPRPKTRIDDRVVMLFPGTLQWHQGVDVALRAFATVAERMPKADFHIYGDGPAAAELKSLTESLRLNGRVRFMDTVPIQRIAEVMASADLGVVPKRSDSFGNEAYSTKIMEFMAVGVPVVVSDTRIDRYYFDDSVVRFFESGDPDALANAILEVLGNETLRRQMVDRASAYANRHSWETRKKDYLRLVDALCDGQTEQDPPHAH